MTTIERLRAVADEASRIADQIESGEPRETVAHAVFGAPDPEPVTDDNWQGQMGAAMAHHLRILGFVPREEVETAVKQTIANAERNAAQGRPLGEMQPTQGGELD